LDKTLQKGKLPPQAVDQEVYVLGACLQFPKAMDELLSVFTDENVFYKTAHQLIFKAMKILNASSENVDLQSVPEQLIVNGDLDKVGGFYYLIQLTEKVNDSASLDFSARIIMQNYMKRKLISISNDIISNAYDETVDVFDLLESATSKVDGISEMVSKGHTSLSWSDAMFSIPKRVEFLTNNQGSITGLPTGLKAVDKHFSGWQKEDFIVIGADSGMGKTALVLNFMLSAAKEGNAVGMFSMEMSVIQLAIRGVANESNYHLNQLMRNGFEKQKYFEGLLKVTEELSKLPIYIDDQPALTVLEMKRKARAMKRKNNIKLLVIDFVQMFSGDKDIRINISEAARACKNLAKELEIPVIALSQLSREVRKARYCIPGKHHLKESSAIEEAADVIGLLYRPSYYGYKPETTPDLYEELGLVGYENACLLVSKNRNGALGNVGLHFIENKTKFVDPSVVEKVLNDNNDVPY
jgi:replicative DNA helicase